MSKGKASVEVAILMEIRVGITGNIMPIREKMILTNRSLY